MVAFVDGTDVVPAVVVTVSLREACSRFDVVDTPADDARISLETTAESLGRLFEGGD